MFWFGIGICVGWWLTLLSLAFRRVRGSIHPDCYPSVMIEVGNTVVLPEGVPGRYGGLTIECVEKGTLDAVQRSKLIQPEDFHGRP